LEVISGVMPVGADVDEARAVLEKVRTYTAPKVSAAPLRTADVDQVDDEITRLTIALAAQDDAAVKRAREVALSVAERRLADALSAHADQYLAALAERYSAYAADFQTAYAGLPADVLENPSELLELGAEAVGFWHQARVAAHGMDEMVRVAREVAGLSGGGVVTHAVAWRTDTEIDDVWNALDVPGYSVRAGGWETGQVPPFSVYPILVHCGADLSMPSTIAEFSERLSAFSPEPDEDDEPDEPVHAVILDGWGHARRYSMR
jgi:hypothetical protein